MPAPKPLLPNWYEIGWDTIKSRVNRVLNTEIYQLKNWKFLHVITDMQMTDLSKDKIKKYKLITINIWLNEYVWIIWNKYWPDELEKLKNKLWTVTGFDDVAWMDELKDTFFQEIIEPLEQPEKYKKYKLEIPNWILFYWPPGCWKTYFSRKLAEEIWYNFYEVKHSDLASTYIHGTTSKIWEVFEKAKENSPSIVFFDEISGLLPKRDNLTEHQLYKEEEVNEFLMQLNDASKNKILVIWATNYPWRIDPAILRSWRIDKKIYIWTPDYKARFELFKKYLKDRPIENIDYDELAKLTWWKEVTERGIWFDTWASTVKLSSRYVNSDIKTICDDCARKALRKSAPITMDICRDVIKNFKPSISASDLEFFESCKKDFES